VKEKFELKVSSQFWLRPLFIELLMIKVINRRNMQKRSMS